MLETAQNQLMPDDHYTSYLALFKNLQSCNLSQWELILVIYYTNIWSILNKNQVLSSSN